MRSKNGNIIAPILLIGGIGALIYASVGTRLQALKIDISAIQKNIKFSFPAISVPISIEITNPNKNNITFQNITAEIFINDQKVSDLNSSATVQLPPLQKTVVKNIIIKADVLQAVDKALGLAITKKMNVKVVGTIKADNMLFPVNQLIEIK